MCMECFREPCHPRCPNAPEPEHPKCALCHREILPDEYGRYYAWRLWPGHKYMCDTCADEMSVSEFAENVGVDKELIQDVE